MTSEATQSRSRWFHAVDAGLFLVAAGTTAAVFNPSPEGSTTGSILGGLFVAGLGLGSYVRRDDWYYRAHAWTAFGLGAGVIVGSLR